MADQKTPLVRLDGNRLVTTSLAVSQHFGKKHKNVLRDIEGLGCSAEFHRLNFEPMLIPTEVGNGAIRDIPAYEMTRDGFTFLCMGFTGQQAAIWKERYIQAFNTLEQALIEQQTLTGLEIPTYVRNELLAARPLWRKLRRYKQLGLTHVEIGRLLGLDRSTVRRHVRAMERCGLLEPPADLPALQQGARALRAGGV